MIMIFNQEEVFVGYSLQEFNEARDNLTAKKLNINIR